MGTYPGLAIENLQSSGSRRNVTGTVEPGTTAAAFAADNLARIKSDLARLSAASVGVIDGLVKDGALRIVELPPDPIGAGLDPETSIFFAQSLVPEHAHWPLVLMLMLTQAGGGSPRARQDAVLTAVDEDRIALVRKKREKAKRDG